MKSISFSAPMIRAILAGAKTMTRRPVKPSSRQAVGPLLALPQNRSAYRNREPTA